MGWVSARRRPSGADHATSSSATRPRCSGRSARRSRRSGARATDRAARSRAHCGSLRRRQDAGRLPPDRFGTPDVRPRTRARRFGLVLRETRTRPFARWSRPCSTSRHGGVLDLCPSGVDREPGEESWARGAERDEQRPAEVERRPPRWRPGGATRISLRTSRETWRRAAPRGARRANALPGPPAWIDVEFRPRATPRAHPALARAAGRGGRRGRILLEPADDE